MAKVFVSFDYDNDKHYKYLLEAWNANSRFTFIFDDGTPREINSSNVGRIKAALTAKIREATHTLVIIGKHANALHPNHRLIGYRNWINYEIAKSISEGNRLAAIKLDRAFTSPEVLSGAKPAWAHSFAEAYIIKALADAPYPAKQYEL